MKIIQPKTRKFGYLDGQSNMVIVRNIKSIPIEIENSDVTQVLLRKELETSEF